MNADDAPVGAADDMMKAELPTLCDDGASAQDRSAALSDAAYWRSLCPWLHVGDAEVRKRLCDSVLAPSADLVDECRDRMVADGYWQIMHDAQDLETSRRHLEWKIDVAGIARGVARLVAKGWPPNFIMMYDEPWLLVHQLKHIVLMATGNRLSYDFSIFHVVSGAAGWPPHRDRGGDSTGAFRADGLPQYCTTWVALSDATCTNSCLHVVPREHDPGYLQGDPPGSTPMGEVLRHGGEAAVQHLRALPCAAGSVIQFSHRLLHWGSAAQSGPAALWRASPEAPRIALSFASTDPVFEKPFLAQPTPMPAVSTRAALIASLGLLYAQASPPSAFVRTLFWDVVSTSQDVFEAEYYSMIARNVGAEDAAASQASGLSQGYGSDASHAAAAAAGPCPACPTSAVHSVAAVDMGQLQGRSLHGGAGAAPDGTYLMFTGPKLEAKLDHLRRLHADGALSDAQYAKAQQDVRTSRLMDPGFAPLARA